ncbi:hypothetical protein [Campylobacter molothri]|uniref:Uncharacterized protein n=1 Tax=Campylobacter molothri TaxID=1032242 RepID=A0ACC5W2X6_9BACT|nr:hypothetical protein [Campylobacter sp. RM10537]MBZ7942891.1 hypothetical protein [Campylobacter sp. W0045]MBZ7949678.1 hypothetical protein [Campylobacter sp. RM10534]MBZ7953005.1 hypothetical protein [Campylobacter sp. RM9939]MBZ7974605.1 hypothetical protein [Campylobacter sp. RM9754]ULO00179.1 hypothetical protein CMOL_1027 [Campylobacter sp. RM10537]
MKTIELKIKMPDEYFELLQSMASKEGFDSIDELLVDKITDILKFEKYYRELGKKDILSLDKT